MEGMRRRGGGVGVGEDEVATLTERRRGPITLQL